MRLLSTIAVLAGLLGAQNVGPAVNVLFPLGVNLNPTTQEILSSADGSWVAVKGSLPAVADVVVTDMNSTGSPVTINGVLFPGGNDIHATNSTLVASRQGHFLVCYGSSGTTGDLVFITRNGSGAWTATNVLFPSSNNVPSVGTKPVISDDEEFIVCRGLAATADFVIVPVTFSAGVYAPGVPFNEVAPGGNTVPLQAVDPVIAPNSLSFAIAGNSPAIGDLIIGNLTKPVNAGNTTFGNVVFPSGNNLVSVTGPIVASPTSNYYAAHGADTTLGDLVVLTMDSGGFPTAVTNVLWPLANNTSPTGLTNPPSVSGDGRIVAVNGNLSSLGDVVLLPISATGTPGTPLNVILPASNNVGVPDLHPVLSADGLLAVLRGTDVVLGDIVSIRITFTSPTVITAVSQNIPYPAINNLPAAGAFVALAPDRSYAVTLGNATIGDIVITPFDASGTAQTPINVLYPSNNNVANLGTTPRISREGLYVLTSGDSVIGDAVVTGVGINPMTGFIAPTFTSNELYPAANNNAPLTREPEFGPTTQFIVSAGTSTIGDLVFVPILDAFPRFRARADVGEVVPLRFISSPTDAGKIVVGAAAFGRSPGILLPDMRIVPLNNDALLTFSTTPLNGVFLNFAGVLDVNGVFDGAAIFVPPIQALHGFVLYVAYVVLDPAAPLGIGTISLPSTFVVE